MIENSPKNSLVTKSFNLLADALLVRRCLAWAKPTPTYSSDRLGLKPPLASPKGGISNVGLQSILEIIHLTMVSLVRQ